MKQMKKLSLQNLWNDLVTEERLVTPRNYIYASDLGRGFVDRLLTMRGIIPTNTVNARTLRVFDVGNVFEIEVVERIFRVLGIFISSQNRIVIENPGLLTVVGRHDPRIGGKIQYEEAKARINEIQKDELGNIIYDENVFDNEYTPLFKYPKYFRLRALALLDKLVKEYPDGVEELITEIKTVNSQAFWSDKNKNDETGFFKGYDHHKLQLHTYVKGLKIPGRLFYISKDDQTLMETDLDQNNAEIEKLWMEDVTKMTEIYNQAQLQPILKKEKDGRLTIADWLRPYQEKNIVWNEDKQEYEKNWKASYSNYLTLITGFKDVDEWEAAVADELKKANTVPCKVCKKEYTRATLNKNDGICGRCIKQQEKEKVEKEAKEKEEAEKLKKVKINNKEISEERKL